MKQLSANQLRAKHKRARARKRKETISNTVGFIVLTIVMLIGMNLFINSWCEEIDTHAENNRKWQQEHRVKDTR